MATVAPPGRTFLDSTVLQYAHSYGEFVFENVPVAPESKVLRVPGGMDDLDYIRRIIQACQPSTGPELVVSYGSTVEAHDPRSPHYNAWVCCLFATQEERLADEALWGDDGRTDGRGFLMRSRSLGSIGDGDRKLLAEALDLGCEFFLTCDRPLASQADHLHEMVGIRVIRPPNYWTMLEPWAPLLG